MLLKAGTAFFYNGNHTSSLLNLATFVAKKTAMFTRIIALFVAFIFISANAMAQAPDTDGDGVLDRDDHCPQVRGLSTNWGCPVHADRDGDLVPDEDDRCPDQPGLGSNGGCPEATDYQKEAAKRRAEQERADSIARHRYMHGPDLPADWKAQVDAARTIFYKEFDAATDDDDRTKAVRTFGDRVRNGLMIQTGSALDYAIEPVMKTRTSSRPQLGKLIAEAWNRATGLPYSGTIAMMASGDLTVVRAEEAEAAGAKLTAAKAAAEARVFADSLDKRLKEAEARRRANDPAFIAQRRCDSLRKTIMLRGLKEGRGASYRNETGVWVGLDCNAGLVYFRVAGSSSSWGVKELKINAADFAYGATVSWQTPQLCSQCRGVGYSTVQVSNDYRQDLPQGYFSGVQVTKVYTRTTEQGVVCPHCSGTGVER